MVKIAQWILILFAFAILYYTLLPMYNKFREVNNNLKNFQRNDSLLFTPCSGRYVLPVSVQKTLHILDSLHAKDYCLYGSFPSTQAEFYQRIQESAWPARFDTNSKVLIGYSEELTKEQGVNIIFRHDNISMGIR